MTHPPIFSEGEPIETVSQDNTANKKVFDPPTGITDPPIDELLEHVTSKYALVIFAAKRARQINSYNQQANDGVFEFVGPLVAQRQREKPLSIALREIDEGLLEHKEG